MKTSCALVFILIFAFFYYSPTVSKSAKNSQKKRNYVIKTNRKQYLVRTGNKRGSWYRSSLVILGLSLQRSQVENTEPVAIANCPPLTRRAAAQPGRGRGFRISQSDCLSAKGWTLTVARVGTASIMSSCMAASLGESLRGGTYDIWWRCHVHKYSLQCSIHH